MSTEIKSTTPKPFVFVLMPFRAEFGDVYKFGIKGAAEEVGAYAERVDEQIFTEGILDRVYNQINKADVIVADMTGQNPNVFYEVGYAHALGKVVLLLTRDESDIPFDLKHRSHIVYGGSIEKLRSNLVERLRWAIAEASRSGGQAEVNPFKVSVQSIFVPPGDSLDTARVIPFKATERVFQLSVHVRNTSTEIISDVSHIYLFSSPDPVFKPQQFHSLDSSRSLLLRGGTYKDLPPFIAAVIDSADRLNRQYRLDARIMNLPPRGVESFEITFASQEVIQEVVDEPFRLRIHHKSSFFDFPFKLQALPHRS